MKQNYIHKIAVLFIALYAAFSAYAYDFSNDDIYYNIISKEDHTVAVAGCYYSMSTLNIPKKVTYNKEVYKVIKIAESAFSDRSNLTTIALPSSLTTIGDYAFHGCSSLTTIALPSSLTTIGDYAFHGCRSLTTIALPSSLTSIGNYAFYNCSRLTAIELPSLLTSIGEWAFVGCPITSFIIPASVTEIGCNPVMSCGELVSLQVEEDNTKFIAIDNVLYDKGMTRVIACAAKEVSVSLPNTVTEIAERAFYKCESLTTIALPSSLTTIGDYAFSGCRSLTTIALPSSLTTIGDYAFNSCSGMTTIALPSSLTSIGKWAFYGCSGMTTIDLPSSLIEIDYHALNCENLSEVICRAQTPPSANAKYNIFSYNTYRNGILKVPAESISQYEISYPWGQFWNIEGISTSGIKDVNVSKTDVTVRNTGIGNIVFENADGMAVSVYSVDGAVMYQTSEYDGETINIGSGIYVVKCGASVLKVRL